MTSSTPPDRRGVVIGCGCLAVLVLGVLATGATIALAIVGAAQLAGG